MHRVCLRGCQARFIKEVEGIAADTGADVLYAEQHTRYYILNPGHTHTVIA